MEISKKELDFKNSTSARESKAWLNFTYILISIGFFLRLFQYFQNRSLWLDEMYLSSSLIKMNFIELATVPMDYQQKAPIGFLWASKLFVILFGKGEMALRLFPLICGLAALCLFLPVCRYFLKSGPAVAIAIGILAMGPPLVYHAVESKQYSAELLGTVFALHLYTIYHQKSDYKSLILWGLWGSLILWFSFSSIFILAGIAGGLSFYYLIKKRWKCLFVSLIPFMLWVISFAATYFLFSARQADSEWLVIWFRNREGFLPGGFIPKIGWFVEKSVLLLNYPLGLTWFTLPKKYNDHYILLIFTRMVLVPLLMLALGLIFIYKRKLKTFFILTFPILLHLVATSLNIYPFFERLLVYLAPLWILLIAFGCQSFLSFFAAKIKVDSLGRASFFSKPGSLKITSIVLVFLLLLGPLINSASDLVYTDHFGKYKHWQQRELYQHINENFKKGDVVYIYWNSLVGYNYYKHILKLKFTAVQGKDYRFSAKDLDHYYDQLGKDVNKLKTYKRIWFVYSTRRDIKIGEIDNEPDVYFRGKNHLQTRMPKLLKSLGTPIDSLKTLEAAQVFLIDKK